MDQCSSGYYVIDCDFQVIHMNDVAKATYPALKVGEKCYKCLMDFDSPCPPCPVVKGIKGPQTYVDPIRRIAETVDAVDVPIEGHGLCHALVFSTVGANAELAAALPTSADELQNFSLIKALTVSYYDVMSVNLSDGTMALFRLNGKPVEIDSVYRHNYSYAKGLENYIDKYVHPEDQEMLREMGGLDYLSDRLKESESIEIHYRVIYRDVLHYFYRKIVRIGDADSFRQIVVGVACEDEEVQNRQKKQELEQSLNRVEYDTLTGLLTREAFMMRCARLLNEYPALGFDLCVLKVENLNLINHQYGHLTGDKTLRLIGRLIKAYDNDHSCLAYMGEGTFVSLTENTDERTRLGNIAAFRADIFRQSEIKTLSLKWSLYKDVERDLSVADLYEKTIYALSTIRANTHKDYVEFDKAMLTKMERENTIENNFEDALAGGELVAWYQPKYSVKTQKIIGAEALVRWIRPDGTWISPGEFIPVLENIGKVNQLDAHIFRQTCAMQKKLEALGITPLPISVNLSRASMFTANIAERYAAVAKEYEVRPEQVPIEITESAAVRMTAIRSFADELISKGFVFHMDDFGAGYSSLGSLQVIPFESIKLDKSLIDYIGKDDNERLLKHVIAYAHESGKTIIAEGVETYEQFLFLKVIGCDAVQGYYFSKPLDEEQFIDLLRSNG